MGLGNPKRKAGTKDSSLTSTTQDCPGHMHSTTWSCAAHVQESWYSWYQGILCVAPGVRLAALGSVVDVYPT